MDVYYKKHMKNGAVASKFKIDYKNPNQFKHTTASVAARGPVAAIQKPDGIPLDVSTTQHDSNCARCYKLKKKCSRTYPRCDYCLRSDAECEYIDRRKRKLRFEVRQLALGNGATESSATAIPINSGDGSGSSSCNNADSSACSSSIDSTMGDAGETGETPDSRKPILIASLVNPDEVDAPFRNIDPTPAPQAAVASRMSPSTSRTHSRMATAASSRLKPGSAVSKNMISSAIAGSSASQQGSRGEFLAVRPISDVTLPSAFMHTFFTNYEWKYPCLSRGGFFSKIDNVSFQKETLVSLDVYLVMAIGCILYDASFSTSHYASFFSDSFVESIVDMASYDESGDGYLLILLGIYAINVGNTGLVWNVVGYLDRLVVSVVDFAGSNPKLNMSKRCFWTIFNLDKELALVLDKPSTFVSLAVVPTDADFSDSLSSTESAKSASFMEHAVMLHKLQDRMLAYRLRAAPFDKDALTSFSADMETWRIGMSSLIHTEYAESVLLQNFIGLVNLDYYYLLVELDQLSATESSQFTLQFLSNSFSLLLCEVSDKKEAGGASIYSLFWFLKFFKVVDYSVDSLLRTLGSGAGKADLMMRMNEFNGNVQLEINLLKFLLNSKAKPQRFVKQLELYLSRLKSLNQKLSLMNPLAGAGFDAEVLKKDISVLFERK